MPNQDIGNASKERTYDGDNSRLDNALHNDSEPCTEIKHEDVNHRRAIHLSVAGLTNIEIAEAIGVTPQYVSTILRQPWARKQLIQLAAKDGEDLREYLRKEGMAALKNMVEIASAPAITVAENKLKLDASRDLVDRWLGKATNTNINIDGGKADELSDAELDKRIAERLARHSPN